MPVMTLVKFIVTLVGEISVRNSKGKKVAAPAALIESHLDDVMDELDKLDAADPRIDLDLVNNSVTFSVLVEAANPIGAVDEASGILRTAIHAAHGATPDWPGRHDQAWAVRLLSLRSDPVVERVEA
jgi:hypothetical protein